MRNSFKRFVALTLALALIWGLLPINALAIIIPTNQNIPSGSISLRGIVVAPAHTYIFKVDNAEWNTQIIKQNENPEYLIEPEVPEKASHKFIGWFFEGGEQVQFGPITVTDTKELIANARFEPVFYVDFVYNGQTLKTKDVEPGETVDASGVPLNVTEPGKVFSHWSETVDGPAFNFSTQIINADKTLYAVTKNAWTVTFDSNGGSAVLPKYVEDGDPIGTLESPTRAGYTFKHWSLTDGGGAVLPSHQVTANLTLYAVWELGTNTHYKVIYWLENAEDDDYTFEEVVHKTGTTGAPATYDSKSYTGFHFDHADNITISGNGDTVVNVHYKRNVYTFTIERKNQNNNNWTTYSTTQLKYGQSTATQYNAAVAAYPYYSWYISRTSNTAYSEAPAMPDANLTVHGRYSGSAYQYTIGYYELGTNIQIKEPYSFYSGTNRLKFTIEDGIDIPGFTVTPMSQWDTLSPGGISKIRYTRNNYNLTFNKNNGDSPLIVNVIPFESDISDKDTTGLNADSTYIQDGITYHFAGWYDNAACVGTPYSLAGKKMPAHNLALYAKWTPEKYTVTFYNTLNEGDGAFRIEDNIDPLHTITPPAGNPSGTDFLGWYWYLNGYFAKFDFETPISGHFKLYPVFGSQTAQVSYYNNGGSGETPTDSNIYLIGAEAKVKSPGSSMLPPASKVFIGWNTAANGSGTSYQPNDLATVPAGGLELFAQWGPIVPTTSITYKPNFVGATQEDETYELANNATHTVIANPFSRPGYSFTGWNTKADGTGDSFDVGTEVRADYTGENNLYAQWTRSLQNVVVTKNWVGGHAVNHTRVVIKLYRTPAGGTEEEVTQEPVVTPSSGTHDTFTHTWANLPTHDDNGNLYTYRVAEPTVPSSYTAAVTGGGYEFTVTNTYHNEKNVEAKKYWRGVSGTSDKVAVWFTLYRTTETGTDEKVPGLNPEKIPPGNDSAHWNNLLGEDEQGNAYTFYVKETDKNGNDWTPTGFQKEESGLSVYNYKLTTKDVIGTKKWVGGPVDKPAVSFELWRKNGTAGDEEKVVGPTAVVNGQVNFGKQRLTDNNDVTYEYYVVEPNVPENYEVSYNGLTATNAYKNTSAVTLTAPSASKTYDGTALTKTTGVTASGLPAGFTIEATASGSQTNVGSSDNVIDSYVIKDANGVDQTAYFTNVTKVDGTLTVNPKAVTITTGSDSKAYDGTPLTKDEASITGLVNGETATVTATGSQTEVGDSKNTYNIDWGTTDSNNYEITENLGTLTVTTSAAEVKLIAADATKVYDGTELTKTDGVTWTGLPTGFTVEATATGTQTDAGSSDNVVDDGYVIKDAGGNNKTANFTNVVKVPGTLTVTKAPVTITTGSDSKAYDGTPLTKDEASITGLVNGETATVTATGSQTEVGDSKNTYNIDWGTTDSNNYEITENLGTLTVTTSAAEVKLIAADATKVYDGTELTKTDGVTWTGLPTGFTVEATATGTQTDAGSSDNVVDDGYVIKDAGGNNKTANFTNVVKVPGTLTVTKAPVTITTGSDSKAYDGTPLTKDEASITGLVNGETATVTATGSQTEVGDSKNTYNIDWGTTDSNNYEITENLGTLTVTTSAAEVKLIAADATKVYDGTELTKTDGVTWTGLPTGFTVEATATGTQTDAGSSDNVVDDGYVIKDAGGNNKTANFTNVVKVPGTLTVTKAPVTITTGSDSKAYDGTPLTKDEASITGLVNGETATVTATGSQTEVGDSKNTYNIDWGTTDSNNYEITENLGTLTVTTSAAEVKLIAADATKVYDGTELTKTDGVTWTGLPTGFTVEATATGTQTDAGSSDNVVDDGYVIKDAGGNNKTANFTNVVKVPGTLTVTKAPVTITTGSDSKAYDGTPLTKDEASITGLVNGETATVTATGSQTEVGDSKNTYNIDWGTTDSNNYEITENLGTLTVTTSAAEVKLIAADATKVYDGTELTKTDGVTWTGLPTGFTVEATATGTQTDAGSSDNVVDDGYVIKDAGGNNKTANFTNVVKVPGTLTVTKAPVTITTGSDSKAYDGTPLTKDEASITGLVNGETATVTATGSQTEVGDSKNTYNIDWGTTDSNNYEITENLGTLTVTTSAAEVKLIAADATKVYDGTALTKTDGVTWTGLPTGFTVEATATGTQTDAGSSDNVVDDGYVIKDAGGNNKTANFTNVVKVPGTLTVTKAPVTITTGSDSKAYDGTPLTKDEASITGLVNGETATVTATGSQTEVGDSKNTYNIDWGTTDSNNYEITENLGTLTVTTSAVEVKLIAADATKVYDGTELTKTDGVTWTGLPTGFTVEATATGTQTDAGSSDNVVDDGYVIKDAGGNNKTANFTNVVKVPGTLTVTKAPVTITTGSDSKAYDGTPLTKDEASITGLVNGETATVTATGSQTEVGDSKNTYNIDWGTTDSNNYEITENLGTLTVTTSAVEVKLIAADATKVYDGTELTKTDGVTWTGLPTGFTVEATATGTQTDAGSSDNVVDDGYVIKDAGGNNKTANFTNVVKVPGTLTVTKAPVTITTGSDSKAYDGTPLTKDEASITGLVNGETATVTATGSQTEVGDSKNTYNIDWGTTDSNNYEITENLGTLTVTTSAAEVKLIAADATKVYDGTELTKTDGVTWTGLPTGFTVEATATGTQTDAGSSDNVVDDGYVIKDAGGNNKTANFTNVVKVPGTLTVTKAPVTITTGSDSKAYDGTPLTKDEASITGLVNGETATVTATGSQTEVGDSKNTYNIDWGTTDSNNYEITENLGTLTVTTSAAEVKLIAADATKVYDGTELTKTDGVTWTGLPTGFTVEATATGTQTDAGSSDNVVDDGYVIKDAGGNNKTANFTNVVKVPGTLTVTKAPVTITTGSDSKPYDGTPLTKDEASIDGLVAGESVTLLATGSQTEVGDSKNTYNIDWGTTDSNNYEITENLGTLTVTTSAAEVKLIAADATKVYDGTELTKTDGVTWTGLPTGFTVEATATGTQTDAGSSDNVVDDGYVIKDAGGNNKTANFTNVVKVPGTLTVTKAPVTITTGSDSKPYDGTPLTKDEASIDGLVAGESVTLLATGSQTEVGSSDNTYSITWDKAKATNYTVATENLGTLTITQDPAIALEKTVDKIKVNAAGDVTYTYTIKNTGDVPLTNLSVTDDKISGAITPLLTELAPGASTTVTATFTITQTMMDEGDPIVNIATASGLAPDRLTTVTSEKATATVEISQEPNMTVEKSADKTSYGTVDEEIKYTVVVTNTGNVTLNNLVLADELMSATPATRASLAVGETWTVEYTHKVTQDDLDKGSIVNAVAVTSDETGEDDPTEDEHEIPADQNPAMTVEKSADKTSFTAVGEEIKYTVVVTNTGNITLNNLVLADELMSATPATRASLAVGDTWTVEYTHKVTQDDLDKGSIVNAVAVTSDETGEDDPTEDEHEIPADQNPAMTVEKSADKTSFTAVGEEIKYTVVVTNTGNITLNNLVLADELMSATPATRASLAVGDTWTVEYTYIVTQRDLAAGKVLNKVSVTKDNPDNPDEPELPPIEDEHVVPGPAFLDIETTINPTKSLTGRALRTGEFTFALRQGGETLQSITNDAEGNILFSPLVYTAEDIGQTYSYTIVEIPGTDANMTYSTTAINFTVSVKDAGDGVLSLTVNAPAAVIFFNIYTPPVPPAPEPIPEPIPEPAPGVPNFDLGVVPSNVADCLE